MQEHEKVTVLGRFRSELMHCPACGYLCMPNPDWLDSAYGTAIACTDTGIAARNLAVAEQLSVLLYFWLKERGAGVYLDVAGGSGLLVRLMRDAGFDFRWSDKYAGNVFASGFEWNENGPQGTCVAVTAIEALEHVVDPVGFIEAALSMSGSDTIIFTTSVYEGEPPAVSSWNYYSLHTGQHISFFSKRTLQELGRKLSLYYVGYGDFHVLSRRSFLPSPLFFKIAVSRARKAFLPFVSLPSLLMLDHEEMRGRLADSFVKSK